jgi:hypothetical protein
LNGSSQTALPSSSQPSARASRPPSLTRWLSRGLVTRPAEPDAPLGFVAAPPDQVTPANGSSVGERVANAEESLVAVVLAAALRGSWQASAWLLERSIPERWARPPARSADAPRVPAPPGVFDEVDELAERRGRMAGGLAVELSPERAGLHPRGARLRVDPDALHRPQVDDDPVVADRMAGIAVPSAADGDRQAGIACESDRRDHVRDALAMRDQRGEPIDGAVPDPAVGS